MIHKIRKAVFPVAGLGTRFLPATKALPKEMLPVVDRPLIQYAVEEAISAGIEELIFVTGRGKTALEDHFDKSYELEDTLKLKGKDSFLEQVRDILTSSIRVVYTRQGEAKGLGHAVNCAKMIVGNEPFAVLLADDIFKSKKSCLRQMVEQYEMRGGNWVAATEVTKQETSKYGIVDPASVKKNIIDISGFVEKPKPEDAPSNIAISGRYILQPEIFDYLSEEKVGKSGEIQLTDAMQRLTVDQKFFGLIYEGVRFDCGSKAGWLKANIEFALDDPNLASELKSYIEVILNNRK